MKVEAQVEARAEARAEVKAEASHTATVTIQAESPAKMVVAQVPQRNLYRKYGWPAKGEIMQRLEMLKEEFDA